MMARRGISWGDGVKKIGVLECWSSGETKIHLYLKPHRFDSLHRFCSVNLDSGVGFQVSGRMKVSGVGCQVSGFGCRDRLEFRITVYRFKEICGGK